MVMKRAFLLLACVTLTACVTTTPDALFKIPDVPQGPGAKTGQFPTIGVVPKGQTTQITPAEVEATKGQLKRDVQKGDAQAAKDNESTYQAEVKALKRLAEEQKQQRQADIESRKF